MTTKVNFIFRAIDKYTNVGRKISSVNSLMKKSLENVTNKLREYNDGFKKTATNVKKFGKAVNKAGKDLFMKATAAIGALSAVSLKQSANLESLGISFEVLIGNAEKAKKVFDDLVQFTATTPFQLDSVANAGKQLLSFGVASENLVPTLRMLGELAAGTGRPLEEFSLIFGKILAKGKVQGEEMLQLAEKGISLQTILGKKFGVSGQVISDAVSDGKISFEIFNEVLKDITGEGGKFNKLTEKLSGSLGGLGSTLKDSTLLAFKELGDILVKELDLKTFIADLIKGINAFTKSLAKFAKENPKFTKFLIIMTGVIALLGPVLIVVGQLIMGFAALAIVAGFLGTTVAALSVPFLIIVGVIGLIIAATILLILKWDEFVSFAKKAFTSIKTFVLAIPDLVSAAFSNAIDSIMEKILNIKNKINEFVSGIKNEISGFFGFSSDISSNASSVTDVNINLKSPKGTVESVKTNTKSNNMDSRIGVNMESAL